MHCKPYWKESECEHRIHILADWLIMHRKLRKQRFWSWLSPKRWYNFVLSGPHFLICKEQPSLRSLIYLNFVVWLQSLLWSWSQVLEMEDQLCLCLFLFHLMTVTCVNKPCIFVIGCFTKLLYINVTQTYIWVYLVFKILMILHFLKIFPWHSFWLSYKWCSKS